MKLPILAILIATASVNPWSAFFGTVLPAAPHDFAALRGAYDAANSEYRVRSPLNAKIVHDCKIFESGSEGWNMRCALSGYTGQAAGPMTTDGSLTRDLTAALPGFRRTKNVMGEPQWRRGDVAVTIVFDGILITHGNADY
jgi:hypothetical protein